MAQQVHFVTGKLAEPALRKTLKEISNKVDFQWTVQVMPITVAALMTPAWIAKRIEVPPRTTRVILPGYCGQDLTAITNKVSVPVEIGPKDLRQLPRFFGQASTPKLESWDIEIIAEINHAPRLSIDQVVAIAETLRADGANWIDVGCEPNGHWQQVGDCVAALVAEGHRVSIDSFNPDEISPAVDAGAELVLSVNNSNRSHAADWGCEVVVIPDDIRDISSMQETIDTLAADGVAMRLDPILEPIGSGFAASLARYIETRSRWPELETMMGIGNLTELTDVDSAGVNFLLLAICQELGVRSVLTTQVINWARTSVRECDIARRLVRHAISEGVPPKNLSDELVTVRDPRLMEFGTEAIEMLAASIRDHNYRIVAEGDQIHLMGSGQRFSGTDPFAVFDALAATAPKNLDASHAFYLGYEMCKAMIALQLGKNYNQDEALRWGHLTVAEENRHRLGKPFR